MRIDESENNPTLAIGINHIRFGADEKHLFKLLFQSNAFSGRMQVMGSSTGSWYRKPACK